jgi:signal transduction histidine kinase
LVFINRGLDEVEAALHRLAAVKGPTSAAAYEMELNVNGMGLAVLKYLATRRPEYREWAQKDESDFEHYHATYLQLVRGERERALGERLGSAHEEFRRLGHTLMSNADRQENLYRAIAEYTEEIDYIIDARLQPALFQRTARPDGFGAAVATADLEAETAEVALWVANYHRRPSAEARRTIMTKLGAVRRTLANLRGFSLTRQESEQSRRLLDATERMSGAIEEVLALEDQTHATRQRLIDLRVSMDTLLDDEIQIAALRGLDEPREEAEAATDAVQRALRSLIPIYLLTAGFIGFTLVYVIRASLAQLNRGTQAIAAGDLTYRVAASANDEFGDLARQYNHMVEQLQATTVSRDRLEESEGKLRGTVEDLRREITVREEAEREREILQAELRRTETMSAMGALVAGVAHEVRNPLFGISSTLDAMSARLGKQGEFQRYLVVLHTEVSRLSKLMADLLSFGKPPTRELVIGSITDVVGLAVEACAALARNLDVTIENRMGTQPILIRHDQGRLVQAFQNLIDNALQHAPRGTSVVLEAAGESNGGWITCSVSDSGPGFQPDDLPRIFDPFFTRRQGGIGLGLALVQRIVHEHGGRIEARNRPEGGALMMVHLPLAQARQARQEAQ